MTPRNLQLFSFGDSQQDGLSPKLMSRHEMLSVAGAFVTGSLLSINAAGAAEETPSSLACSTPVGDAPANCVSTASVRKVDLYMSPWNYPDGMPVDEVMARLKGAISTDVHLELVEQKENYLKARATRNFAMDELEFVINPAERVITFRSQQVDGPDVNDFGGNRKRLDDLKRRAKVFDAMSDEFGSADSAPREGPLAQLKAFYGLQSGAGYEDLMLDE